MAKSISLSISSIQPFPKPLVEKYSTREIHMHCYIQYFLLHFFLQYKLMMQFNAASFLLYSVLPAASPPHLMGRTCFRGNTHDEWLIVHLLLDLSMQHPNFVIR